MERTAEEMANYLPVQIGRLVTNTLNSMTWGSHYTATIIQEGWRAGKAITVHLNFKADINTDFMTFDIIKIQHGKTNLLPSIMASENIGQRHGDTMESIDYDPYFMVSSVVKICILAIHTAMQG
jgi:hypothetical protein